MKKVGLSDTVLAEMWRKLRVARVNSAFFAVSFWKGKVRSTLVKIVKKSLDGVWAGRDII